MARLRPRWFTTPRAFVLGILLAEVALLPVLPRVALAYGPVPVPATGAPATTTPAPAGPPTAATPAPGTPTSDAPPPYPPAGAPPPGYPPAGAPPPAYPPAGAPPPGYPPAGGPPPGYPQATQPPPNYAPAYPRPRPPEDFYRFDAASAAAAAERDAKADTSSGAWFFLGCLLGGIGVIIAYVSEPSPPPARLIGKSPEWVIVYSAAYKSAGKSSQGQSAIVGCLVMTAIVGVLIAASSSSMPQ